VCYFFSSQEWTFVYIVIAFTLLQIYGFKHKHVITFLPQLSPPPSRTITTTTTTTTDHLSQIFRVDYINLLLLILYYLLPFMLWKSIWNNTESIGGFFIHGFKSYLLHYDWPWNRWAILCEGDLFLMDFQEVRMALPRLGYANGNP